MNPPVQRSRWSAPAGDATTLRPAAHRAIALLHREPPHRRSDDAAGRSLYLLARGFTVVPTLRHTGVWLCVISDPGGPYDGTSITAVDVELATALTAPLDQPLLLEPRLYALVMHARCLNAWTQDRRPTAPVEALEQAACNRWLSAGTRLRIVRRTRTPGRPRTALHHPEPSCRPLPHHVRRQHRMTTTTATPTAPTATATAPDSRSGRRRCEHYVQPGATRDGA